MERYDGFRNSRHMVKMNLRGSCLEGLRWCRRSALAKRTGKWSVLCNLQVLLSLASPERKEDNADKRDKNDARGLRSDSVFRREKGPASEGLARKIPRATRRDRKDLH